MNTDALTTACRDARGLAIDAVAACNSGHLGLPLGATEIGAVLFGHALSYNPDAPRWLNRDVFVLSAGHGSMFLYTWLHLSGYAVTRDDLRSFRALHSRTPGHPEAFECDGVEATTGPLGQGVANAVGFAVSQKMAAARFNTAEHTIFDAKTVVLCGDGCMQEGVASEAAAFAGHQRLDNLIIFFDSNDVTLDAMADASQSEDTAARFAAYGFDVQTVADGHDLAALAAAYERARTATTGRPQLIVCKTQIGRGIPEVAGTNKAHGEGGKNFADKARAGLGLPTDEKFFVDAKTLEFFAAHKATRIAAYDAWNKRFDAWAAANPQLAALLASRSTPVDADALLAAVPTFAADTKVATRKASETVLQTIAEKMPLLMSGSADLHGSTLNYIKSSTDFSPVARDGRNVRFGIREHAMGAMMNGIAYHQIFRASGATFLVFSDYLRPSIRVASLVRLPVTYIFTHDSVGVGEDGPTHHPVETVAGLRVLPNLDVVRPADPEEVAGAYAAAMSRTDGPTLFALTRQAVPMLVADGCASAAERRRGVLDGAYVLRKESAALRTIVLATGSEVSLALDAVAALDDAARASTRVVSMPCAERFKRASPEYRESVLPHAVRRRVAIEAGVTSTWGEFIGLDGKAVGVDRFGLSAPGAKVLKELGITADAVVAAIKSLDA